MAYLYGFKPWEILQLTFAQFCSYREWDGYKTLGGE